MAKQDVDGVEEAAMVAVAQSEELPERWSGSWKQRRRGGREEVEALRGAVRSGTQRRDPLTRVCEALRVPHASVSAAGAAPAPSAGGKRGPKTRLTDTALLGELRVGRQRVLRLMRRHHLLVPSRPRHAHGDPAHAGTIITTRPDEM